MKITILLFTILLLCSSICFSQSTAVDSLKAALQNAKDDTTRINIYLKLGEIGDKKDRLSYIETVWNLCSNISSKPTSTKELKNIVSGMNGEAVWLLMAYYTDGNSIQWNKVNEFLERRVARLEKLGIKKRTAETLEMLSNLYGYTNDTGRSLQTTRKSLAIYKELKDAESTFRSYNILINYYISNGDLARAFETIQISLKTSRELNYTEGVALNLSRLADLYRDNGEDAQALENYNNALTTLHDTKDSVTLFNVVAALGGFYYSRHNTAKALECYKKLFTLNPADEEKNLRAADVYSWIGMVYKDDSSYTAALNNFEKSFQLYQAKGGARWKTKSLLDEIGSLYQSQGILDRAVENHQKAIRMADSMQLDSEKGTSESLLAKDYFLLRKYDSAKKYNNNALSLLKMQYNIKSFSEAELLASQIDSARQDGLGAYNHYKAYISLTNKLKGEEIRKEAQKESFQNELAKRKAEQEKRDNAAKRVRNLQYLAISALGIVILAVSVIAIIQYKNNQQKRKATIALRQEKEKVESTLADLKATQVQLIQSEKMASLGELTAGIAHEIQNPLNFVNNFSDVNTELIEEMEVEIEKGDMEEAIAIAKDIRDNNQKIAHHGRRAESIVKGMLQHSRTSSGKKEPTDINALTDEYLRLAYHGLRAKDKSFNATLTTQYDETLPNIEVVPQDIGRALLNLMNNAFYAVNEKMRQLNGEFEPTVFVGTKRSGNEVKITIRDNGTGIPQNVMEKVFQPFFTTKPTGQGTGLGLSLGYDIVVKGHGGSLTLQNIEGEGAAFVIILPASLS